jgi:hypothetical protein
LSIVGALLLGSCASRTTGTEYEPSPECEEFCSQEAKSIPLMSLTCVACFEVGADGVGHCEADLNNADKMELAAIVRWAVAGVDEPRVYGESCEMELCPLVDFLDEHRQDAPFETLSEFKHVVAQPSEFEGAGLAGFEVRVNSGWNSATGDYWGGLKDVSHIDAQAEQPSCCVGVGCDGTDYWCEDEALVQVPTLCEALPDSG